MLCTFCYAPTNDHINAGKIKIVAHRACLIYAMEQYKTKSAEETLKRKDEDDVILKAW